MIDLEKYEYQIEKINNNRKVELKKIKGSSITKKDWRNKKEIKRTTIKDKTKKLENKDPILKKKTLKKIIIV